QLARHRRAHQGRRPGPLVSGEFGADADAAARQAVGTARPFAPRHAAHRPRGAAREPARALPRRAIPPQMVIAPPGLVPYQIGVVVTDLDAGIDRYSRLLGLSGWKRMETDYVARYRDWEGRIANRNAFAPWGAIHLEMVEP